MYVQFTMIPGFKHADALPRVTCNECSSEYSSSSTRFVLNNLPAEHTHRFSQSHTSNLQYCPSPTLSWIRTPHTIIHQRGRGYNIQTPPPYQRPETRTHPTICDCREICLLSFCHQCLNYTRHQRIHRCITSSHYIKTLPFICVPPLSRQLS